MPRSSQDLLIASWHALSHDKQCVHMTVFFVYHIHLQVRYAFIHVFALCACLFTYYSSYLHTYKHTYLPTYQHWISIRSEYHPCFFWLAANLSGRNASKKTPEIEMYKKTCKKILGEVLISCWRISAHQHYHHGILGGSSQLASG